MLKFTVDGKDMNIEGTLNLLAIKTAPPVKRLGMNWHGCLNVGLFARVHNTLAKEKRLRIAGVACHPASGWPPPKLHVEPAVEALRNAVVDANAPLSHCYATRSRPNGCTLRLWKSDRNAPPGWNCIAPSQAEAEKP
jgi:oligoendopeptidase F